MFKFIWHLNFVFLRLPLPDQLRCLTWNFRAIFPGAMIYWFEFHQQNVFAK